MKSVSLREQRIVCRPRKNEKHIVTEEETHLSPLLITEQNLESSICDGAEIAESLHQQWEGWLKIHAIGAENGVDLTQWG